MTGSDRLLILGFVGIAQQTALASGDLLVRGLVVGLGLATASGIQQLAGRRDREVGVIVGIVAEFFAFAIAVALFERYAPLAPALLIWPIVAGAFFLRQLYVLYLAALATAMVFEIGILRNGAHVVDLIAAVGWGALYVSLGAVASAVAATLRRVQRHAASAYASVATVSTATTYAELAEIVFAYVERVLDLPADAPAASGQLARADQRPRPCPGRPRGDRAVHHEEDRHRRDRGRGTRSGGSGALSLRPRWRGALVGPGADGGLDRPGDARRGGRPHGVPPRRGVPRPTPRRRADRRLRPGRS